MTGVKRGDLHGFRNNMPELKLQYFTAKLTFVNSDMGSDYASDIDNHTDCSVKKAYMQTRDLEVFMKKPILEDITSRLMTIITSKFVM